MSRDRPVIQWTIVAVWLIWAAVIVFVELLAKQHYVLSGLLLTVAASGLTNQGVAIRSRRRRTQPAQAD